METRNCACCGSSASEAKLFLKERIDPSRLNTLSFSSRKPPEFMNHRLVRCLVCDLVYTDLPPSQSALAAAYHDADFDSSTEADDAAAAYFRELRPLLGRLPRLDSALEIGCGTGTFLALLHEAGFGQICGFEPSTKAIHAAPPQRRSWIKEDIFRPEEFAESSFDLICCFMTLEHVQDPRELTLAVSKLLRPGGAFAVVVHDWRAGLNRLLGRRSPIIDIEHLQLFSPRSIEYLLGGSGLTQVMSRSFTNRYAVRYWARLLAIPDPAGSALSSALEYVGLSERRLSLNVGNRICIGWRP